MSNNSNKSHYNAPLVARILREYTLLQALEEGVGKRMLDYATSPIYIECIHERGTLLSSLFIWEDTSEGHPYWAKLDNYLEGQLYSQTI